MFKRVKYMGRQLNTLVSAKRKTAHDGGSIQWVGLHRSSTAESDSVGSMLTERFEQLWLRLTGRWVAYQDTPRRADQVPELAEARARLDDARSAIRIERQVVSNQDRIPDQAGNRIAVTEDDLARLRVHVFPQS